MIEQHWLRGIAGAALVLLLLVSCGVPEPTSSPSTPTPTMESAIVRLAPDGSGDYVTLAEAVQAIPEGGTIMLEAGIHRLESPLNVEKAIRLEGAGRDQTEIVSQAQGHVVRFSGSGPFAIEGITFRQEGEAWTNVIEVHGGEVTFADCRFSGGRDAALSIEGKTTGVIRNCVTETGQWAVGILIKGQADLVLEGNTSSGNGYGIRVSEQAQPTLTDNVCNDNQLDGIRYDDEAGGVARGNKASGNRTGIVVGGQAQPQLVENMSNANRESGFQYIEKAGGLARRNQCSDNFGGIGISDEAQPTLEENVCNRNVTAGFAYFGSAGGTATGNDCSGNGIDGIGVFAEAQPTLEGNICNDNGEVGISYRDNAGGVARDNECSSNKLGIHVAETAAPDLQDNRCQENTEADIRDLRP